MASPDPPPIAALSGADHLLAHFERWPSFHDAEILRVELTRTGRGDSYGPTLQLDVHVRATDGQVDERGYYRVSHEAIVGLEFCEVTELRLEGMNHQNVLWDLVITDVSERQLERVRYRVVLPTSFGLEGEFYCREISVRLVTPGAPLPVGARSV